MQETNDVVWTNEQIHLQRWLALPKKARQPKTAGLLAVALGVDEVTLWRWRKLEGFAGEVRKLIRDNLHDDLADIYGALRTAAKDGSYNHIKLALELAGEYVERSEVSGKDGNAIQVQFINYRAGLDDGSAETEG